MAKPKTIAVCTHCREPHWHAPGCIFAEARKRDAMRVLPSERGVRVAGTAADFKDRPIAESLLESLKTSARARR